MPEDSAASPAWSTVVSRTTTVSHDTFPAAETGKVMCGRDRTIVAKEASPSTGTVSAIDL